MCDFILVNSPNFICMKCSIWEFPENVDMSIAGDDSTHYSLKHVAELPVDISLK